MLIVVADESSPWTPMTGNKSVRVHDRMGNTYYLRLKRTHRGAKNNCKLFMVCALLREVA